MITPLNDRVVVTRFEEKEVIKNGIVVPDNAKEKPAEGLVIAVGSGKVVNGEFVKLDVQVGDRVAFGKYSGVEMEIDDVKVLILREEDILVKIT